MVAQLTWFHVALLFVAFAAIAAVAATVALGRMLARLEAAHAPAWRGLGSPRVGGMAPGAGPRLFRFLRDREWRGLGDADVQRHAKLAFALGLGAVFDLLAAAAFFGLFFAGVPVPDLLSGIPAPF